MKANPDVARAVLQALYDEADVNGTAKFDVRISDTEYLRYITVYPNDSDKHCLGTCQGKDGEPTRSREKEAARAEDRAELALSRMDECQKHLKRIDRAMGQARGKVGGVVLGELERAQRYWIDEYDDALHKHYRNRAEIEMKAVMIDRERNR